MAQHKILGTWIAGLALLAGAGLASAQRPDYLGKSLADWAKGLDSNDPVVRRGAVFALGKMGSSADDYLAQVLKILREDKDGAVREAAAFALGPIGSGIRARTQADLVPTLAKALTSDPDPLVQRSAAVALGKLGSDAAAAQPQLEQALANPKAEVRQNAAWALGKIGGDAVTSLRKILRDRDSYVLRDAANAVGELKEKGHPALPELLVVCQNKDTEVKKAALGALVGLVTAQDTEACAPISLSLKDADPEVRFNAALALGNIGGNGAKPAVPVLVEALLQKADPELRKQAAGILKNIGPAAQAALQPLTAALKDPDPELRRNVAVALGGLEQAAAPAFKDLAAILANAKEVAGVRVEAAVAMAKIGNALVKDGGTPDRKYIAECVAVLKDPSASEKVRERALWVLRVYQQDLPDHQEIFDALVPIVAAQRNENNKMLRYDGAFMLGAFWREKAPKVALDVLLEFLKDDSIKIYAGTGVQTGGAAGSEKGGGTATVKEIGAGDGRVMAVVALRRVGRAKVEARPEIMQQLRGLRNSPDPRMQQELGNLFKEFSQ